MKDEFLDNIQALDVSEIAVSNVTGSFFIIRKFTLNSFEILHVLYIADADEVKKLDLQYFMALEQDKPVASSDLNAVE